MRCQGASGRSFPTGIIPYHLLIAGVGRATPWPRARWDREGRNESRYLDYYAIKDVAGWIGIVGHVRGDGFGDW